jgi:Divergent InlB B-repeat domain
MTQYGLTVIKSGTGSGRVTSSPEGITCGTDCAGRYKPGSVVTLTAQPKDGSTFTGWSGDGCSGNGQCALAMSAPRTVTANFSAATSSSQVIIDNRDAATLRTGSWYSSNGLNFYGVDSVFSRNGATFTWNFTPSQSGNYNVSMWWSYRDSRSTSIPVDIQYSGGKVRVFVNQQQNSGQWNNLGKFYFNKGVSYPVTIISRPYPTSTCADAIKFKLVP